MGTWSGQVAAFDEVVDKSVIQYFTYQVSTPWEQRVTYMKALKRVIYVCFTTAARGLSLHPNHAWNARRSGLDYVKELELRKKH